MKKNNYYFREDYVSDGSESEKDQINKKDDEKTSIIKFVSESTILEQKDKKKVEDLSGKFKEVYY